MTGFAFLLVLFLFFKQIHREILEFTHEIQTT